jgi:erythromycin esterase-like protein
MKGRISAGAARSGLCVIFSVYLAVGHCEENGFAKWASAHAHPITTIESQANDSDLLPLESAIGTSHVVAFGEPTHGAHEPLALRNRLFRFLVERMGFTAIALESGFTESMNARSFLERGVANSLGDGLPGSEAGEFGSLSSVAQADFERSIEAIAKAVQKSRKSLIAHSSEEEYRWAVHNLGVARQFAKCLPLTPKPGARDRSAWNAWVVTFECRDSAMARNVQWALPKVWSGPRLRWMLSFS